MPAERSETSVIEHELTVAASPETIFAYFTDPARVVQWMGADATLDPRPGGVFRLVFKPTRETVEFWGGAYAPDATNVVLGEFVEVDPYTRIVFTWGFEEEFFDMPPQASAVEVSLTPEGETTLVRLAHRRLPAEARAFHTAGWEHYLPRMAVLAAGGDPGPDPWEAGES